MKRRAFCISAVAFPLLGLGSAHAQAVRRIGWLSPGSSASRRALDAFRQGMRELGYVEGRNLAIEFRWAEGKLDRLPQLAAELVQLKPEVIVSGGVRATAALKTATSTIPIVMASGTDPVGAGLVASLAHPGGNVTGAANQVEDTIAPKLLELIHNALPKVTSIAVLMNQRNPSSNTRRTEFERAAKALGVSITLIEVSDPDDMDAVFATLSKKEVGALMVPPDALFLFHRERLVRLAAHHRIPAVYPFRAFVDAGGLMSYDSNLEVLYRRAASYVDKILKGAKPGDLPIEQPTNFELVVNLKTAKTLGITIPQSILLRADKVIE